MALTVAGLAIFLCEQRRVLTAYPWHPARPWSYRLRPFEFCAVAGLEAVTITPAVTLQSPLVRFGHVRLPP
jgi:hypothetical protein